MKSIPLLLVLLFGLTSCSRETQNSISTDGAPSPIADSLSDVAAELDDGALAYQVIDGGYQWQTLEPLFSFLEHALSLGAMEQDDEVPPELVDAMRRLPDISGLNQIAGRGQSTVELDTGGYRTVSVIQSDPGADGLIWNLAGTATDLRADLARLPADTSLYTRFSLNAPYLYDQARRSLLEFPRGAAGVEEAEADIRASGFPLARLLAALNSGVSLAVTLNEEVKWILPLPGGVQVPEIGLVVLLDDPDGSLITWLTATLRETSPMPMMDSSVDGLPVSAIPIPLPTTTPVALQIAAVDGQLVLASNPALLQEVIVARTDGAADSPLAARLGDLETNAYGGWVSDGRIPALALSVAETSARASGDPDAEAVPEMMDLYLNSFLAIPGVLVASESDGMYKQVMLHDAPINVQGGQVMAAPALVGMLAAIAVPSFQKARASAQENACINNLRMIQSSKDQWAIENNRRGSHIPAPGDLSPYLREGIPECPGGGSYEVGTVEDDPVCSIHGAMP